MSSARQCCLCKGRNLSLLFNLDDLPISHFLRKKRDDPDPRFSVGFENCQDCGLLQIVDPIPADLIYGEADTYTTGFQQPRHLEDLITTTVARQDPGRAIDIGCNDGSLLDVLRRAGATRHGAGSQLPSPHAVVALSALLDPPAGGVALLGLPPVLDELRHLPPFPAIGCRPGRLLRARPTT